mmetsp:Transcript_32899/g.97049  ORF Transcript_32899/g.97049 Transcript_32899/m.97049 type:complete len:214 (+) Transcript_32899:233-874(+)
MSSSEASSASAAVTIPGERIYLFRPTELDRAKAGNFADVTSRSLQVVNTKEAAAQLVRDCWVTFTAVIQHDTENTGLSSLPTREAEPPPAEAAASLDEMLPPSGPVQHLPKKMSAFYNPNNDRSLVDMVVECYEVKVVDADAKCVRHPICMWPSDAKERKNAGCDDSANFNNRLAMYYAIKGGTESIQELKTRNVKNEMSLNNGKGVEGCPYR